MKKTIKLQDLQITSFLTSENEQKKVKGGIKTVNVTDCTNCNAYGCWQW
ncbi:pinensin family lanthipeptide [Roseivirga sp. BDSF3-8]